MTIHNRLKSFRQGLGLSQEAFGDLGLVSAPGWIKIENGQRSPSEKLLKAFVDLLVERKHVLAKRRGELLDELLALKYLADSSPFVRKTVRAYLAGDEAGANVPGRQLLAAFDKATAGPRALGKRGRPVGTGKKGKASPR